MASKQAEKIEIETAPWKFSKSLAALIYSGRFLEKNEYVAHDFFFSF